MSRTSNLSQPIIESLYTEALVLADEVRAVFALGVNEMPRSASSDLRLALSSEGLKATTRMMHVLAWLLNQRAFFSGELTENQLRKHSQLPEDRVPDPDAMDMLEPATCDLIDDTVRLHRRIARLDRAWRDDFSAQPSVRALHERIGRAMMERDNRHSDQRFR